jgi:hypothetical protein
MKAVLLLSILYTVLLTGGSISSGGDIVRVSQTGAIVALENASVKIEYDLSDGTFSLYDKVKDMACISGAFSKWNDFSSLSPEFKHTWKKQSLEDGFGKGLVIEITSTGENCPRLVTNFILHENHSFLALSCGLVNTTGDTLQLKQFKPIAGGKAFAGCDLSKNFSMLDGNSGGRDTRMYRGGYLHSRNNLLATFGDPRSPYFLVMGGLTYDDFEKFAEAGENLPGIAEPQSRYGGRTPPETLEIQLFAEDPVGKKIDPGSAYLPRDMFYIDGVTGDPFEALEKYGRCLKTAQKISINPYYFPTVCLWCAFVYGDGSTGTDTPGAVAEMERIVKSGFLKYTKAAVRLVPDNYAENNQQGWWDDAHWQRLQVYEYLGKKIEAGWYHKPYETTRKWGDAITRLGGIPITYVQTGIRSQDYAEAFPGHMLFNQENAPVLDKNGNRQFFPPSPYDQYSWIGGTMVKHSYDYTDPGFLRHLRTVYKNLRDGGVKGLMFDYPNTGWAYAGGMEDRYSTTAHAYRNIFRMAREGLGPVCYIDERDIDRGSDISLGLIDSQRTWGDTDVISPAMTALCGLRWYKNRVVVNYDLDSKNLLKCDPQNRDQTRSLLTMCYVVSGRFLLGNSFGALGPEKLYDLSRIFPFHSPAKSARPLDAFIHEIPSIYDFAVDGAWHQVTLYNSLQTSQAIPVALAGNSTSGALGLHPDKMYYVYDFWNDTFVGKLSGEETLRPVLRAGEARMLSVHEVIGHPQFISTNRHIMQGYVDLHKIAWDGGNKSLSGESDVPKDEEYTIIIAGNGYKPVSCRAEKAESSIRVLNEKENLSALSIKSRRSGKIPWTITFAR